jgi:hypothetical protein
MDVKPTHDPEIDCVLELDQYHNVLETYTIKLRQTPDQEQISLIKQKDAKKH